MEDEQSVEVGVDDELDECVAYGEAMFWWDCVEADEGVEGEREVEAVGGALEGCALWVEVGAVEDSVVD